MPHNSFINHMYVLLAVHPFIESFGLLRLFLINSWFVLYFHYLFSISWRITCYLFSWYFSAQLLSIISELIRGQLTGSFFLQFPFGSVPLCVQPWLCLLAKPLRLAACPCPVGFQYPNTR